MPTNTGTTDLRSGTATLRADYSQLQIVDEGGDPPIDYPEFDLDKLVLVAASPGGALIFTGMFVGYPTVTFEIHNNEPPEADGWNETSDATYTTVTGRIGIASWGEGPAPGLPLLTIEPGSTVHVRVYGRGREQGRGHDSIVPAGVEHYLVQMWS